MMVYALHDMVLTGTAVAQVADTTPEAPPLSAEILGLVRYFTWFALLSGIMGITFAGGRFAWEKWNGGALASPKMIVGGLLGGTIATSAGSIMDAFVI
ncbi:hypothetical protein [Nocardia paucivorans]|uniref:hypothetical protein n=1 Tax=Nocardia paucivorans TaxID=114259 RepID=UPI001575877A